MLIYFRYWCAFGPHDARNLPASNHQKRKNVESNRHFLGCQCHFVISRLYLWPTVARIAYTQYQHVDMLGNVCHGPQYNGEHSSKISFALLAVH